MSGKKKSPTGIPLCHTAKKRNHTGKSLSKAAVRKLGRRSFRAGRTQNILISMAVVIVTILITAACSVFYNIQRFGQVQELKETGAMTDVVLSGPDEQQLALLRESALVQQPLFVSHKVGRLVGNPGQSGLSLYLYAEENWETWSRPLFTDIQGNYPVKENEVMMSVWLLKRLGIDPVIGCEIPLSVTWEDREVAEEETFVLSGYYTDTSYIDTASRQKVLVSAEALGNHSGQAEFVGFSLTAGQFQKKLAEIRKELSISEQQSFKVLGGQGFHLSLKDMGTALAVILFFMLDGFLIIYNINTISVTKDIQFYGLLKTIGTAPGQLKRLMYYRMGNILLTALPVGLVLGGVMTQWIVPLILGGILEGFEAARFHLIIPLAAAFFSGLMIFVSFFMTARKVTGVSAIGALTFAEDSSQWKKGIPWKKGIWRKTSRGRDNTRLFQMGLKNVFRQPRKAWMVIGTFFLSSVTFLLCMTVLGGMSLDEFIDYNTAHDLALYNSMSRASFSPQEEQSFTPELVERLQSLEGVESFEMTKVVPIYEHYSEEVYGDWLEIKNEFEQANGMEPTDTGIWLDNPKATFWSLLVGIDSRVIEGYNLSAETPIDIEGFEKGEFLLTTDMNGSGLHTGSRIPFSVMDTDEQFELPIGGQIPLERDGMNSGAAPWLVVSNKVIDRYREDAIIYSVKIDSDSEYEESILNQTAELTEDIPAISRTSKVELARSLEETKGALSKLSAFLTIVLFTVGILNFINTMSVSILGRQREFATMEAVGASKRQMQKLIAWEGIWYFLLTLALSVTLGSGVDFLIFYVIRENMGFGTFRYPVLPMTLYMLLSMLLCMVIPAVVYRRAGIRSIVERLRDN